MIRLVVTAACLALLLVTPTPAAADVIGEGVSTLRCTEGADLQLPKKMTFWQTVSSDRFTDFEGVVLFLDSEFEELDEAGSGKIVATVFHHKADGSKKKLGKVKANLDDEARAEGDKAVAATLAPGDRLEWRVKLTRLPMVLDELQDCWDLSLVAVAAEQLVP